MNRNISKHCVFFMNDGPCNIDYNYMCTYLVVLETINKIFKLFFHSLDVDLNRNIVVVTNAVMLKMMAKPYLDLGIFGV